MDKFNKYKKFLKKLSPKPSLICYIGEKQIKGGFFYEKTKLMKKLCTAVIVSAICCTAGGALNTGAMAKSIDDHQISIQNVVITEATNALSRSGSSMNCYGKTSVPAGYKASVIVELQKYNGGWATINRWSATGGINASVSKSYGVESGYKYRVKSTHRAYDSNGKTIETIVKYSGEVW